MSPVRAPPFHPFGRQHCSLSSHNHLSVFVAFVPWEHSNSTNSNDGRAAAAADSAEMTMTKGKKKKKKIISPCGDGAASASFSLAFRARPPTRPGRDSRSRTRWCRARCGSSRRSRPTTRPRSWRPAGRTKVRALGNFPFHSRFPPPRLPLPLTQYLVPFSSPQPISFTEWNPRGSLRLAEERR